MEHYKNDMKKVLVTGTAGFIGFHLTKRFVDEDFEVIGLDIINDYYDANLKYARLEELGVSRKKIKVGELVKSSTHSNLKFLKMDIADHDSIVEFMMSESFDYVVNLAAQAGVRYSIENPRAIHTVILMGFYQYWKVLD